MLPIVEPSTASWRKKMWRRSIAGVNPEVAPQVTIRPPVAVAVRLAVNVSPPTCSITTSTPRLPVSSRTAPTKSVVR